MEKKSAEVNRRVKLRNLFDEKIIIENNTDYEKSVFAPIYKKANSLVEDFQNNSKDGGKDRCRQETLQIVNTISFEGRRGTGKTSAMMSFCNQLREKKKDGKDLFIVLDYIDASALEEGESILEIVLANMYHLLSERMEEHNKSAQYDYEARNIIRKFEEIYNAINFINERRRKTGRKADLSPLSGLERLSNSQQLKKEIYDLIRTYKKHIASDEAMLVIPIDDIDMCFQSEEPSVYEVMETLHRYLMIPNVVVFLTYDYPELLSGCEKHFSQMLYLKDDITDDQKEHIRLAANRYLEKVLPTYARIHLPSQRKRDYSDQNNIQVCLDDSETEKYLKGFEDYLPKCWDEENDTKQFVYLNPKQFALLFKASNCGLFYDSQGQKRHYAEPSDFRDMVHIVTICKQLSESYHADTDERDELVFKELLDDLYFRFARVNLVSTEAHKRYFGYLEVNIERRSKNILDDIWKKLKEQEKADKYTEGYSKIEYVNRSNKEVSESVEEKTHKEASKSEGGQTESFPNTEEEKKNKEKLDENRSYSYGELLYGLYRASSTGAFSKPLIWCILDSYTIMLTKLHRAVERKKREYKAIDELKKDDAYQAMKGIIGPSISSSWSNSFVPKIKMSENKPKLAAIQVNSRVGAIKFISTYQEPFEWQLTLKEDNNQQAIIQTIEILCMFFTNVEGTGKEDRVGFTINYNDPTDSDVNVNNPDELHRAFKFEFISGCFNIMNFVNNLFFGEEFFDTLHKQLKTPLMVFLGTTDDEKAYDKILQKYSLKEKYEKWKAKYKSCAMPLYSFDMMYNIMKRQYLDTLKKHPNISNDEVTDQEFLKRLLGVYADIQEALGKQDSFYYKQYSDKSTARQRKTKGNNFETAFKECPFMLYMSEIKTSIENNEADKRIGYLQQFFRDVSFLK